MIGLFSIPDSYLPAWMLPMALTGLGLAVGILTGLFGVGGGFMIVPILSELFGINPLVTVGSSLSFMMGTSAAGVARHLRLRNVEPKSMLILGGSAVCGVLLGKMAATQCQGAVGVESFRAVQRAMFIIVLSLTAWLVLRGASKRRTGPTLLQRLPLGPKVDLPHAALKGISLPGLCAIGLGIGVLTGVLGIGGGVLFVPLLILVVGLGARQAIGTSLGVVMFGSLAGTIAYGLDGKVSLLVAMSLLVGSAFGVLIGAHFCQRLHETRLRRFFAILVMLMVVWLVAKFIFL